MRKNMQMFKKIMALLLVFCMVFGLTSVPAAAAMIDELGDLFQTTAGTADVVPAADVLTMTGYELGGTFESLTLGQEYQVVARYATGNTEYFSNSEASEVTAFVLQESAIEVQTAENGVISVPAAAYAGDEVTLTLTPNEDYTVYFPPTVTDAKGNAVDLTAGENRTYTFTMPATAVSVSARFDLVVPVTFAEGDGNGTVTFERAEGNEDGSISVYVKAVAADTSRTPNLVAVDDNDEPAVIQNMKNGIYCITIPANAKSVVVTPKFDLCDMIFEFGTVKALPGSEVIIPVYAGCDFTYNTITHKTSRQDQSTASYLFLKYDYNFISTNGTFNAEKELAAGSDYIAENPLGWTIATSKSDRDFFTDANGVEWKPFTIKHSPTSQVDIKKGDLLFSLKLKVSSEAEAGQEYTIDLQNGPSSNTSYDVMNRLTYTKDSETIKTNSVGSISGKIIIAEPSKNIIFEETENGTVTADALEVNEGDTVALTVTPASGYALETLSVTDEEGNAVPVTKDYIFVMPAGKVTVKANFVKAYVKFTIGNASGTPGEIVQVPVTIDTNISSVNQIVISPKFNKSVIAYAYNNANDVTLGEISGFSTISMSGAQWDNATQNNYRTNVVSEGVTLTDTPVFYINYKIKDDAIAGTTSEVNLYGTGYKNGSSFIDASGNVVSCEYEVVPGKVTVEAGEKFDITIAETENGTVTADKTFAGKGEGVTLTVTPDEGYMLDSLTVTDAEDKPVTVTDNAFTMPASAVTVRAVFVEDLSHHHAYNNGLCECGEVEPGAIVFHVGDAIGDPGEVVSVPVTIKANYSWTEDPSFTCNFELGDVVAGFGSSASTAPSASTWHMKNGWSLGFYIEGSGFSSIRHTNVPLGDSEFATIDLKIKENAKPGTTGTFKILASQLNCDAKYYVHAGMITVRPQETYAVNISETSHGTINADKATAAEGDTVTLTVTPAEGYKLDTLTVTDTDGSPVTVTNNTFTMPGSAVTVAATFVEYTTYAISTEGIYDGTVKAYVNDNEVTYAEAGEIVTLKAFPNEGYVLDETSVCVLDSYGQVVLTLEKVDPTTYIFTMPEEPVRVEAVFHQVLVEGTSTATLSCKETAYPGELIYVTLSVSDSPKGNFHVFDPYVALPEGWEVVGAEAGTANQIAEYQSWEASKNDNGRWGLWAQNNQGSMGMSFPSEGDVLVYKIRIADNTAPDNYKLDLVSAGLKMGTYGATPTLFGQCVDTIIEVKSVPENKIKLDAPSLTADHLRVYEDMIESFNVPVSEQDISAAIEYSYSTDNENWSKWAVGSVINYIEQVTNDDITTIATGLKENTKVYVRARYVADNTTVYVDSDASEAVEVTTKSWPQETMTITFGDAAASPGETFTIPVVVDHNFGDFLFCLFDIKLDSTENFTLISAVAGKDMPADDFFWDNRFTKKAELMRSLLVSADSAKPLCEGELILLTFRVNDNVEPGTYELEMPSFESTGNCSVLEYYRAYFGENRDSVNHYCTTYPVNRITVNNATITVKTPMNAPVLTDAKALADSITVAAPPMVSGVSVEYSISKDGENWGDWQSSNVFEGLDANTEYHFRARYIPDGSEKYGPSAPSNVISATTSYDDITFVLGDAKALPGETVVIPVTVSHELTKDANSVIITPAFDKEKLALESVSLGKDAADWKLLPGNEIQIYVAENTVLPEGEVLNLTFKVLDGVSGDVSVGLTAEIYSGETTMKVDSKVTEGNIHVHNKVTVEGSAATCYGEGLTDGEKCSLCEEILKEQTVIKALGHVLEETVVPPTHNQMGYTLVECKACDYAEIKDFTDALDHDYVESVTKEATCTENGEMTFTCECGESYTQVIPKAEHDCDATVTDATCESIGYTTYDCKNCDYSYVNDIKAALGHKETVVNAKEATHDDAGYTGDTVCSVCKDILKQGEKIAAWGCPAKDFSDVDTTKWYHDAVDYVLMNKLMTGTGNGLFAPNDNTTRAMMATLLYRMAGEPSVEGLENPFTDVKAGTWYTDAIIWAADKGVVSGTSATTFAPNDQITREQMVTMIWRYAGKPESNLSVLDKYADADNVSDYAKEAMAWAISNGIVTGVGDKTLAPKNTATRAQIAAILMRYCEM